MMMPSRIKPKTGAVNKMSSRSWLNQHLEWNCVDSADLSVETNG